MLRFNLAKLPRQMGDGVPLLLWLALIFFLSSQPTLLEIENASLSRLFFKSAHFGVYAILAWLWWRALSPHREPTWPVLTAALALTSLYGLSDEIHQLYVPGRNGRVADVLFDTAGGLAMILLLRWHYSRETDYSNDTAHT
jgi:VanZ family protein